MTDYLAAIQFDDESKTYEALYKVQEVADTGAFSVIASGVLKKDASGRPVLSEGNDDNVMVGTLTGGALGLLVGVLGGPLGMLFGAGIGTLGGALVDSDRADYSDAALSQFAQLVGSNSATLVLETEEPTTDALDNLVAKLGGKIVRRETDEVVAELEAQDAAAADAVEAARAKLRDEKRAERKESMKERIDALKAKLHHDGGTK